ncbi:MAG: BTAD domain-containing putative transcriptional regulator, partial [Acidimicrobiia bacterium]|nr:BTAD domain-containing putative transcriptional regulator [Acidimicrobiia bacterium]
AMLALNAPETVSSDKLVDELWGDDEAQDPESALHVAVSRLRSVIDESAVETMSGGYRLGVPMDNSDLERFRRHTQRGRQLLTLGHPRRASEALRHALAQWRGEALADLRKFEFAERASQRLDEERLVAVESLMEAELAAGNHGLVVGELSGLIEAYPYRERLWGHLMLALYRSGRQAEALRTFGRLKTLLAEEMGIEPSAELSDLEERILLHDPALIESIEAGEEDWAEDPELVNFAAGEVIVQEGAPADSIYWVETGRVEVVREDSDGNTIVLADLGPGHYFGELASLLRTGRTATVRAAEPTTVSVHNADSFRSRLGAQRASDHEIAQPSETIRQLIRDTQYLEAYDQAMGVIESGVVDPEIRWLAVLALRRSGAIEQARRRYEGLGLASIDLKTVAPRLAMDIAALGPTLDKEMALAGGLDDRAGWARRSAQGYESAFSSHEESYLAVNAATMWLVAGEEERARAAAKEALSALGDTAQLRGDDRYWGAATEAEAALVIGDIDRAMDALARAGEASKGNFAGRSVTLHQLKIVCGLTGCDPAVLSPIANPNVVHFCGHRILPEGLSGRFPAEEEARVAAEFTKVFAKHDVGFGYGSLAAGADILAAEALLDRGAELHIILPFDREEFVRTSVAPAGHGWVDRFERCLGEAIVRVATPGEYLNDPILFDFCSRIAMGRALMKAKDVESEAIQVAVWDGVETDGLAGTAVDVGRWRTAGQRSEVIAVQPAEQKPDNGSSEPVRQVRGIVFGDFAGFSTLSDAQLLIFQDKVMGGLARGIEPFRERILSSRTWGDGVYIVIDDIGAAAEVALAMQEAVRDMDFEHMGLTSLRSMRVAAHATPVFDSEDAISGERVFFGAGVTQAARIEPRTPEGEIYTTYPFAALAVLEGNGALETQYVGTLPTAKGYGSLPLFALRRAAHLASEM